MKDEKTAPILRRCRHARRALTSLARAYRAHLGRAWWPSPAASGKTTTKEYTRAVLRTKYRVRANAGQPQQRAGVTILGADEDSEYHGVRSGCNQRGEIDALAPACLRPDIAVITNIGDAHGLFRVARRHRVGKGMLLRALCERGRARGTCRATTLYFERLNAIVQERCPVSGARTGPTFAWGHRLRRRPAHVSSQRRAARAGRRGRVQRDERVRRVRGGRGLRRGRRAHARRASPRAGRHPAAVASTPWPASP